MDFFKKIIGWPSTWFFYLLGDLICKMADLFCKVFKSKIKWAENNGADDNGWAKFVCFLYGIYSTLMGYSADINNWAKLNVWSKTKDDEI